MTFGSLFKRGLINIVCVIDDIFPFIKIIVLMPTLVVLYSFCYFIEWLIYMKNEIKEEWNKPQNGELP